MCESIPTYIFYVCGRIDSERDVWEWVRERGVCARKTVRENVCTVCVYDKDKERECVREREKGRERSVCVCVCESRFWFFLFLSFILKFNPKGQHNCQGEKRGVRPNICNYLFQAILFLGITRLLLWLKPMLLLKNKCDCTAIYMKTQCLQNKWDAALFWERKVL